MDNFAIYKFQFGYLKIGYENDNVVYMKNVDEPKDFGVTNSLTDKVFNQIEEYLKGNREQFDFPYELRGTDFQKQVWKVLTEIPYGETRSYKDIALAIGNPKAYRAVGMANNKNPIVIAVPCHRVIGTDGSLTGYALGLDMKAELLELEKNNN